MSERSEGRKHRKYSNFKEGKRVILAKKEEKDNENKTSSDKNSYIDSHNLQPKIILKSKEKEQQQIIVTSKDYQEVSIAQNSQNSKTIYNKEIREATSTIIEQPIIHMTKPVDLITTHNLVVNSQSFEHLLETNLMFHVVGIIGMKGVGKSTILNLLTSSGKKDNIEEIVFGKNDCIFPTQHATTGVEGIQMYISKDRTIFLDCSPLLHNSYKKDCTINELDDLKMTIFLLSVCHLVIVVQEDYLNTNLIRLLQNAEMMKPSYLKDSTDEHYANIMFIKNFATRHDFSPESREMYDRIYKQIFKNSKLNVFTGNGRNRDNLKINVFAFPKIDLIQKNSYLGHPNLSLLITELKQRVFMSPKTPMLSTTTIFSEKNWSQLIQTVWETHKSNFFLHILENGNVKDKMYMIDT